MSASSWYSDSEKLKSRQALSSDKLGDSTEEVTNNGKMSTSGKGKDDSSSREVKSNQRSGPTPPKLAIFDGKSEWKPYFMQFNHIARKYEWSNEQKLDRLIECLRDKALKFVSTRQETVQKDYDMLVQKLSQRFEIKIYLTPLGVSCKRLDSLLMSQ
ncbi:unnamed protein product [Mytilus coruscus]|uniref:Uncharacterized protein n=1 Tax=Mytilus coruscus TaxID=42192 RepID=A0A6J8EPI8_MYTCO|nr:unnamed protein product [Mytilus coruscus]